MKEHPIIFNGEMVKAILGGCKTVTRRIVKPQPTTDNWPAKITCGLYAPTKIDRCGDEYPGTDVYGFANENEGWVCPYGVPGDRLWVREAFSVVPLKSGKMGPIYRADGDDEFDRIEVGWQFMEKWRPSIHMPRWASRITLEVVSVRVERVQDIDEMDATHEGIEKHIGIHARHDFSILWDSINAKRGSGWDVNPWVWAIEFKRLAERERKEGK